MRCLRMRCCANAMLCICNACVCDARVCDAVQMPWCAHAMPTYAMPAYAMPAYAMPTFAMLCICDAHICDVCVSNACICNACICDAMPRQCCAYMRLCLPTAVISAARSCLSPLHLSKCSPQPYIHHWLSPGKLRTQPGTGPRQGARPAVLPAALHPNASMPRVGRCLQRPRVKWRQKSQS